MEASALAWRAFYWPYRAPRYLRACYWPYRPLAYLRAFCLPYRALAYLRVCCTGPAAFEGKAPAGGAGGACIERDMGASFRGDAPAGERAGDVCLAMTGEEKARNSGGARGKPETPGRKRGLDLGLSQTRAQRGAFQPFFQSPGGLVRAARFDDEEARRIEPRFHEARPVRASPFLRLTLRHAPQHQTRILRLDLGDRRERKAKPCRRVAIGMRFDLVQASLAQDAQGTFRRRIRGAGGRGRRR